MADIEEYKDCGHLKDYKCCCNHSDNQEIVYDTVSEIRKEHSKMGISLSIRQETDREIL